MVRNFTMDYVGVCVIDYKTDSAMNYYPAYVKALTFETYPVEFLLFDNNFVFTLTTSKHSLVIISAASM